MDKKIINKLSIALYEPRIPQNTGNIGRTCLAFDFDLHLILPLGFEINNKRLKRAGLDYWKYINLELHESFAHYSKFINPSRIIGFSKEGGIPLSKIEFQSNDSLLFGREDLGLPSHVKNKCDFMATIPMPGKSNSKNDNGVRSLNLSVACGIASFCSFNCLNHVEH
ncbi:MULTISPECIES: tRNA (cytidine(34)-2'-O)-methyltransferase [Prochlorococcus]|uniref:Putative tRNA (cytidine(34)-2'-O)-methyltransferase n=1 Tax=Prochlorococcus marinus (strain SARG / CCMP1375 / SS120) TaxID=167539 RepID=Q7VBW7_PROMA|nr:MULTISPECIES: tRNA (cytidine(34)-2'-O)-methyltransferase [Prochlorococcus]AAQ00020.1 Predicted rRNA methylase [Prochlorococcus marinus subsp. marinus str. CCMP1375]KGG13815.1 tRNA (cytosine34-2'-O-)-methyltransferase [Prochlorococcus marinus str. LG]KGG18950.1 tRNA (cytosine34-2'-O-)-methyltransferase [Prochlorococcus marinus str. SS2]KGG23512.1 tRNA (cytosine34-2'-O-)-methyltransferase [Prochlorococcus marinus str. SS35]KGG32252.1 tRNA (cytosine34-2'-O-)-methyltransferase [Prochlorococcus 